MAREFAAGNDREMNLWICKEFFTLSTELSTVLPMGVLKEHSVYGVDITEAPKPGM